MRGFLPAKDQTEEEMLLFSFLDMFFFPLQPAFQFLSYAIAILSRCRHFFFHFSKLELKCQWMYLGGALQLFRGFEARSAADRGTLCLWRQMKRLFVGAVFRGSYRRFVFFSLFFFHRNFICIHFLESETRTLRSWLRREEQSVPAATHPRLLSC